MLRTYLRGKKIRGGGGEKLQGLQGPVQQKNRKKRPNPRVDCNRIWTRRWGGPFKKKGNVKKKRWSHPRRQTKEVEKGAGGVPRWGGKHDKGETEERQKKKL